jgi:Leucine-rich repeat (LRR) protein
MMELDLGNNRLTKLPEEFGNMDRLVFVSICDNKIEVLPESLGKCKYIDKFLLDRFGFTLLKKKNSSLLLICSSVPISFVYV